MKGTHNQKVGRRGEQLAAEFYEAHGAEVIDRNFRMRRGEIDLIVQDEGTIVFVEVKARMGSAYGRGVEAVDYRKQQAMLRAAEQYIYKNGLYDTPMRFDVVEIQFHGDGTHGLNYIKNALISA